MSAKFFLQDQNGERISLNRDDSYGIRLVDVAGLGTQFEPQYANLENGFFTKVFQSVSQGTITGTILFSENPYENYRLFVNWILTREKLYLIYKPKDTEYFCDVELSFISKTEMSGTESKQVPISFSALTPWYLPQQASIELVSGATNTTRYNIVYTEELKYATSAAGDASAEVEAIGHLPAAILLTWRGAVANPVITLTGLSGKEYGKCEITGVFISSDTIELSTRYGDAYIIKRDASGNETDLINSINITKNPFFLIPIAEPCVIRMTAADVFNGRASIKVFNYHRSV